MMIAEVTAEMIAAGERVLEDAVAGCPDSMVSTAHMLGDYLGDVYRAMRALEPEAEKREK